MRKYAINAVLLRRCVPWLACAQLCAGVQAIYGQTPETPAAPVAAQSSDPTWSQKVRQFFERDYLFGDWGGVRTNLSAHGVDFEFFYAGLVPSNVSGGLKQGSVYEGALLMTLDLDSDRLVGYHGGHFHVGSLWLHSGRGFSENYVGDLNVVSLIDFPDSLRLWELWYQQKFFDDKLSLKFGQMAVDRDFILPELYGTLGSVSFLNQTFFYPTLAFDVYDVPGFPRGFHGLASTPYGTPGILLRWEPTPEFYVQSAVYDGNPDRSYSGTRINLNDQEGALAYFEAGYHLNQKKGDFGLPGAYKVGGYYHTDDFVDAYEGASYAINNAIGLPSSKTRNHSGNYGVYLLAEQMLYREKMDDPAQQGLTAFFRAAGAPADRNLAELEIDGGLVYKGLIPSRDYDTLGVAASYLEMSHDLRRAFRDANSAYGLDLPLPDYETVLEVSYKAQIAAWWTLQPSVQWVLHPGGRVGGQATRDAVVVLALMTLRL
jgi:porin